MSRIRGPRGDFAVTPAMRDYLGAFDRFLQAPSHEKRAGARLDMQRELARMYQDARERDAMTLRVIPDIYRLNAAQREQLLNLYDAGLVESPVYITKRYSGRVVARDAAGNGWLIHRDGWADMIPDR